MGKIYDALEKSKRNATQQFSEPKLSYSTPMAETNGQLTSQSSSALYHLGSDRLDKSLVSYFNPDSYEAEQFRKLAAAIVFHNSENTSRCLLITSATKGEGKSFCSANLAVSLAKSLEESVILMDCDLRRPQMHKLFGLEEVPGLSDHFSKGIELSALIQETAIDNLSLLPAGTESFHSTELLSSKRMTQALETFKNLHKDKIILIDSPPPSDTTEPVAIARRVDKVILVIRSESTPRAMVEDLIKTIGKEKILGLVLNWSRQRAKSYYKYST
jgi:capsular exopolysaccharide synthesis family protein